MGNMHLVTGNAGKEHITAADQGAFNAALIGTGQFVLDKGRVLEAQAVSNNQIRILDGELMMQGRFIRLDPGIYVDLTIDSGTQGMQRNDLVVARYTKNAVTGVEDCDLVVIKGTAVASNPVDPAYTKGDITNGQAVLNDFPLWRIPINGINVGTPEALFGDPFSESMLTLPEIRNMVNQIHAEVDKKIEGLDSYTKEETLSDEAKTALALDESATPDDAFLKIGKKLNLITGNCADITLTVVDTDGNPVSGVTVGGIFGEDGNSCCTDTNGILVGFVSEGNATLSVSDYLDVEDYSETIFVNRGNSYTKTITLTRRESIVLTSSAKKNFTADVTSFDVTVIGGGGGGFNPPAREDNTEHNGGGGGGGHVVSKLNVAAKSAAVSVVVGSGGAAGNAGGTSSVSFYGGDTIVSAAGGGGGKSKTGGAGNGAGGNSGANGGSATAYLYDDESLGVPGGGGGGSGKGAWDNKPYTGGSPYGGRGAYAYPTPDGGNAIFVAATGGSGYGGGGGGGYKASHWDTEYKAGGAGYQGAVFMRWRFKTA